MCVCERSILQMGESRVQMAASRLHHVGIAPRDAAVTPIPPARRHRRGGGAPRRRARVFLRAVATYWHALRAHQAAAQADHRAVEVCEARAAEEGHGEGAAEEEVVQVEEWCERNQ